MNWQSFKSLQSTKTNKEKGDAFELLVKNYLSYDPQYATKLTSVWLLDEVPAKIHRKLNLPTQDQGIDLICETKDGEYWAVQAKYHQDEQTTQTWRSLSTFTGLAFGVCKNISFGLVCTTAERFTKTLKNQDNIGFCTGEVWRNLGEDYFNIFEGKRKPKRLVPFKPYAHQKGAIKNAYKHFIKDGESRGKLVLPCGTGKSLTAFWMVEKLDSKRILVAVPSLSLIRQTLQVWLRESYAKKWDVNWITVCSDKSVSKIESDDLAVLTQDLGIPALTDPKLVSSWLRKKHSGKVVVFATYQSGKALAEATKLAKRKFDVGIMDEAHKTVGAKEKSFAHLLFQENIKIDKRIFMTATERRYRGKMDDILSMDDHDIYGETFEYLSFKDALDYKEPQILSDYKIVTVDVNDAEIKELINSRKFVKPSRGKWDKEVQADNFAALIALRKAIKKFKIKHALSFHGSIARAEAFQQNQSILSEQFSEYGGLDTFFVSGKMATAERDRHIDNFKNSKRALISNARCLTEGVDVPAIDCVLFADPKKSTVDIVQAVGRALRVSKGKKYGYIIIPVSIKENEDFEKSQAYQSILYTLRAIASNDERIIEYFKDKANGKKGSGRVEIILSNQISEKINANNFKNVVELTLWNKLAKLSWRPFDQARDYARSLKLESAIDWSAFSKSGEKPNDIPSKPQGVYKDKGWVNWSDWLKSNITRVGGHAEFIEARKFVRNLKLKSMNDWYEYINSSRRRLDIPKTPHFVYKDKGWISYGDWFGTGKVADQLRMYKSFKEARAFARKLKFKKSADWREYYSSGKMPIDLPLSPNKVYKGKGWVSFSDFLGYHGLRDFVDFKTAKRLVKDFNLVTVKDWKNICRSGKKPLGVPSHPYNQYKTEWVSWADFFGIKKDS